MDNLGYLFAGFTVAWTLVFLYVFTIGRRLTRLEEQVRNRETGGPL